MYKRFMLKERVDVANSNSLQSSKHYANWIPMKEISSSNDRLFPFPIYNRIRKTSPVRYDDERKCWDIFSYEDVQFVLKPEAFLQNAAVIWKEKAY